MSELVRAEEIYRQLAERDLVYYEKRIKECKDAAERWRMHVLLNLSEFGCHCRMFQRKVDWVEAWQK